jgi:hypothetical protein
MPHTGVDQLQKEISKKVADPSMSLNFTPLGHVHKQEYVQEIIRNFNSHHHFKVQ